MAKRKAKIFALIPEAVEEGDVVVLCDSPWGHAALCTQPHMLFEAMPEGLHRRLVFATAANSLEKIQVLRLKPSITRPSVNKIAERADELYGHAYDYVGAVSAAFPWLKEVRPRGSYFCSQVIAKIYEDCGIKLFAYKHPDKVKPRDFLTCDLLENVSVNCVRELDARINKFTYEDVIEAEEKSIWIIQEMKMVRRVLKKIMDHLEQPPENIYSMQDLWEWLGYAVSFPNRLPGDAERVRSSYQIIVQYMDSEGFWEFYQQVRSNLHLELEAIRKVSRNLDSAEFDIGRVDSWLRSHEPTGFTLFRRRQFVQALKDWAGATGLSLFRDLEVVFSNQLSDIGEIRLAYDQLLLAYQRRVQA